MNYNEDKTMINLQQKKRYEIGLINLFFMGRILVLNLVNLSIAQNELVKRRFRGTANLLYCIGLLRKPGSVMMHMPLGASVDSVIEDLLERFQLDELSLSEVQLCLKKYNPNMNYNTPAPNDLKSEIDLAESID